MFNGLAWTLITIEVTVYKIVIFPKKSLKRYIALGWVFWKQTLKLRFPRRFIEKCSLEVREAGLGRERRWINITTENSAYPTGSPGAGETLQSYSPPRQEARGFCPASTSHQMWAAGREGMSLGWGSAFREGFSYEPVLPAAGGMSTVVWEGGWGKESGCCITVFTIETIQNKQVPYL